MINTTVRWAGVQDVSWNHFDDWKVIKIEFDFGGQQKVLDSDHREFSVVYDTIAKTNNTAQVILERLGGDLSRVKINLESIKSIEGRSFCDFVIKNEDDIINGEFLPCDWHTHFNCKIRQLTYPSRSALVLTHLDPLFLLCEEISILTAMRILINFIGPDVPLPNIGQGVHLGFVAALKDLEFVEERKREEEKFLSQQTIEFSPSSGPSPAPWMPRRWRIDPGAQDPLNDPSLELSERKIKRLPKDLESGPYREHQMLEAIARMEVAERNMLEFCSRSPIPVRRPIVLSLPEPSGQLPSDIPEWHQHFKARLLKIKPAFRQVRLLKQFCSFFELCHKVSISSATKILGHLVNTGRPNKGKGIWVGFTCALFELQQLEEEKFTLTTRT